MCHKTFKVFFNSLWLWQGSKLRLKNKSTNLIDEYIAVLMMTVNGNNSQDGDECSVPGMIGYPVIVVNILSIVFGTFSNILLWLAVLKNKQLHTLSNYFLLNLNTADLIVTAITQPMFTLHIASCIHGKCWELLEQAYGITAYFGCIASILSIATISVDRLIVLKYPLQKRTILTKRRGLALMSVTWILATTYTLLSCVYKHTKTWVYITFAFFTVSYVVMISAHSNTYMVSHRFVRRRKEQARRQSSLLVYHRERQAAKTIAMIMAVITLAWLPYGSTLVVYLIKGVKTKDSYTVPLLTIGFLNSSFNTLLYSWRNKELRVTSIQLLKCQDPNIKRRESASSLYIRRSRISTASIIYNDCNVQAQDANCDVKCASN